MRLTVALVGRERKRLLSVFVKATRRRGRALLQAINEATLAELAEAGYARLTIEAVAARAGTGKAALYRRWPAKRDLVLDALNAALPDLTQPLDEAADLREALLACLQSMSDVLAGRTAFPPVAVLVEVLREAELGAGFRDRLIAARLELVRSVLQRAADRGEIDRSAITPLAIRTGPALVLQGVLMTGSPPSADELEQIVDQIVLPILKS
jgi:AcrR family transcriptional regulator